MSFIPPITAGLKLSLAAADATVTGGTTVTGCTDASGLSNNATATGTPTLVASIFGSLPAIRFNGTTDCLKGLLSGWTGFTGSTLFLGLANYAGSASIGSYGSLAPASGNDVDYGATLFYDNVNVSIDSFGAPNSAFLARPTSAALIGFTMDASTYSMSVNGVILNKGATSGLNAGVGAFCFANRWSSGAPDSSLYTKYDFGLACAFNVKLSDADFASVGIAAAQYLSMIPSGGGGSSGVSLARVMGGF